MEEFNCKMWKGCPIDERESMINKSRDLMIDVSAFESAMLKAVNEWPFSCEANLTASVINHQAWLGHAGCAINHDAPEELTRLAWSMINKEQQDLANLAADKVKNIWMERYVKNNANK
jgi:hypothetical protein